jgi:replication fork protection complex subunit Tof1/Swi1
LTWPLELDDQANRTKHEQYPNLKLAQANYKRALLFNAECDILGSIMRVAFPSLALDRRSRTDKDTGIIRLVLYLLRNLAAIEGNNSRSETILAFQRGFAFDFINVLASGMGSDFHDEDVIIIDLVFELVRGVSPTAVYAPRPNTSTSTVIRSDLNALLSHEKQLRCEAKIKAHTRHNRFGTMVSVVKDDRRFTVASQTGLISSQQLSNFQGIETSKRWNKPQRHIRSEEDLDFNIMVNVEARIVLASFASAFLDAGFNPLFATLLKGLELEHIRISPANRIQFLYLQGWFLQALRASAIRSAKNQGNEDFADDADYALVASMMETRAHVMLRKMMREALDLKVFKEAQAGFECFKQLLLTVNAMSLSSDASFQDIADNLLANMFYEEASLEQVATAVRGYKNQSIGYLNTITDLASVLLRMIERYSSTKSHIYVRARRQRQKRGNAAENTADVSSDEESTRAVITERAFSYAKFEGKFINDHAVDTFLSLLEHYADLNEDQVKRCIGFFHRVFVKQKKELFLYRLDLVELLHRMLQDQAGLSSRLVRVEVQNFSDYYMKRFAKQLAEAPALGWELLFNKLDSNAYYLTHKNDRPPKEKRMARVPAELELKTATSIFEGIRVCVAILIQEEEETFLRWVHQELSSVLTERQSWADRHQILHEKVEYPPGVVFTAAVLNGSDATGELMHKNNKARLLLNLLGCDANEDDRHSFTLPADADLENLRRNITTLQAYLRSPPTIEPEESAMMFFRRKIKKSSYYTDGSSSSDGGGTNVDHKPAKKRKTTRPQSGINRAAANSDESQVDSSDSDHSGIRAHLFKRQAAEQSRLEQIKSAKYVLDSDEENEEEMAAFFAREEAQREQRRLKQQKLTHSQTASVSDKENWPVNIGARDGPQFFVPESQRPRAEPLETRSRDKRAASEVSLGINRTKKLRTAILSDSDSESTLN